MTRWTDVVPYDVDPADFVEMLPEPERELIDDRVISGYYDADDGYAHMDELGSSDGPF